MAGRLDRKSGVTMEHCVAAARSAGAPRDTLRWFVDHLTGDNALARKAQVSAHSQRTGFRVGVQGLRLGGCRGACDADGSGWHELCGRPAHPTPS